MITFAVTAYRELSEKRKYGEQLFRCIQPAQEHPQVDEIVIVDDGSDDADGLAEVLVGQEKVSFHRNVENRGVFGNKLEAIARARGGWVITCDSDNLMRKDFLDHIIAKGKDRDTWYCPSFARPEFDYRSLVGTYVLASIQRIIDQPMFQCAINTGNQTVHHETFMEVFGKYRDRRADLMMPNWLDIPAAEREKKYWRLVFDALDSFIFNLTWLQAGKRISFVPGLEYDHYCSGDDAGNYVRSPPEKEQLGKRLLEILRNE